MPASVNRPWSSVVTGPRPGADPFEAGSPRVETPSIRSDLGGPAHAARSELDPGGRLTVHVDELAADDLLGAEPDLGGGLLGVGVELGPAEAEAGAAARA